jgi:hypothetical protein
MKGRSKKTLWFICILLVAVLVITVSAAVYNTMYMQGSITVGTAKVKFVSGDDSTVAGATFGTNGTYVSFSSLSGWPNSTRTYQYACGVQNLDTSQRTIELKYDSWSGNTADVNSITVIVRSTAGGTQQGTTITVGTTSTTGQINIPASTTWVVEWNIMWKATALSTDTVAVTLDLIVTGA